MKSLVLLKTLLLTLALTSCLPDAKTKKTDSSKIEVRKKYTLEEEIQINIREGKLKKAVQLSIKASEEGRASNKSNELGATASLQSVNFNPSENLNSILQIINDEANEDKYRSLIDLVTADNKDKGNRNAVLQAIELLERTKDNHLTKASLHAYIALVHAAEYDNEVTQLREKTVSEIIKDEELRKVAVKLLGNFIPNSRYSAEKNIIESLISALDHFALSSDENKTKSEEIKAKLEKSFAEMGLEVHINKRVRSGYEYLKLTIDKHLNLIKLLASTVIEAAATSSLDDESKEILAKYSSKEDEIDIKAKRIQNLLFSAALVSQGEDTALGSVFDKETLSGLIDLAVASINEGNFTPLSEAMADSEEDAKLLKQIFNIILSNKKDIDKLLDEASPEVIDLVDVLDSSLIKDEPAVDDGSGEGSGSGEGESESEE